MRFGGRTLAAALGGQGNAAREPEIGDRVGALVGAFLDRSDRHVPVGR